VKAARLLVALGIFVGPAALKAQHYRVVVGLADTRQMLLLDFSPCIPAEGSGCGGFFTRMIDPSTDSTVSHRATTMTSDAASNGRISIVDGTVVLTTTANGEQRAGSARAIVDSLRAPVAVVTAGPRYAFAVLAAKRGETKAQVRMFDLATRTAVASLLIDGVPTGIGIAP
jgi:hypothetical protein